MTMYSDVSFTTVALGIATFLIVTRILQQIVSGQRQRLPPGPKPLPLIGNLHQAPTRLQWFHFYNWSKEYGPIMHLSMAGQPLVILSSVEASHDLLSRRSAQYSDRPRMVMAGEMVTKGMHMLLRQYDAQYRLHQRMEAPLLNVRAAGCYRPFQDLESRQLLFDVLGEYDLYGEKGIDAHHHFERAMASLIYTLLYGYRLKTGHEQELSDAKRVQGEFAETGAVGAYLVDTFPVLNVLPRPLAPWKKKADELWNLERALHVGNLEKGLSNPGWNFAKHMKNSVEAKGMSTEELAFDLGILADAALDTSTMSLDWLTVAWITGGKKPGWVAKAQQLLDNVVGKERLPSFEDRPRLAYIDAIVNEVNRWRPVVPGGVPHFTKKEDTYLGYHIPANSIVMGNHFAVGRDEAVFGDDVNAFIPERWLDAEGNLNDLPQTSFGFGRRVCTGRNIARNGLYIQVARIMWAFDVDAGMSESTGERAVIDDMACTEGFATKPRPFKAVFRPRGPWVRSLIEKEGSTHNIDHAMMLDQAGQARMINVEKK